MGNTFSSRNTLKTKLLAAISASTTADQIVKLSRSIEKANLDDDADLETALDTKVSTMAASATTEDIEKLAFGVKKLRTPEGAGVPTSTMIAEGSSNLYVTQDRVRGSFSASGDLSYDSGTGVLSYTALPDALTVYATVADLPSSGVAAGAKGIVEENKKLYVFTGASWVGVGLVDQKPSFNTNPDGSYALTPGGDTVITLSATDPQGDPITFSHVVSAGSLGGSTVSQADNVFTITGSTNPADTAPFSITFRASDGTNITDTTPSEFTVVFAVPAKIVIGGGLSGGEVGAVYVFDPDDLSSSTKLVPADGNYQKFGWSSFVTSDHIIVGAPHDGVEGTRHGAAYIYNISDLPAAGNQTINSTPIKIFSGTTNHTANHQGFGYTVLAHDDYLIVGADQYTGGGAFPRGIIYFFTMDGTPGWGPSWQFGDPFLGYPGSNQAHSAMFGKSMATNGTKFAVGAPQGSPMDNQQRPMGEVLVFNQWGSKNYTRLQETTHGKGYDLFGWSLAMNSNKLFVGAPGDDGLGNKSGVVYVYDVNTLAYETQLAPASLGAGAYFGVNIAASEDKLTVLADYSQGSGTKSVFVYDLNNLSAAPTSLNPPAGGFKVYDSVSMNSNYIIIGSSQSNNGIGKTYVYDTNNLSAAPTVLTAFDESQNDQFGWSVSIG